MTQISANKTTSKLTDSYLIFYNGLQTLGWSYLLYQLLAHTLSTTNLPLYECIKFSLIIFQNAAILEVVHALTGIVRSNPIITSFQVASRITVVCGVFMATTSSRQTIGLGLALIAWSITEVIRYSTYSLILIGHVPYFLKWLRYTTFIVLYPVGVTGELLCLYAAQKEVGEGKLYSLTLPNKYNFIFNYQHFLVFIMLLYIPLFPQLYLHMFSQRKKVLAPSKKIK